MLSFFTPEVNHLINKDYISVKTHLFGNVVIPGSLHNMSLDGIDDPYVVEVIETLHQEGYKVYIIGGAVRDWIMEAKRVDYDLVSDITIAQARELFGERFATHTCNGLVFGKVCFTEEDNVDLVPLTPFPAVYEGFVELNDLKKDPLFCDSMRRDLTINSLYFDPYTRDILDYHGGLKDLRDGFVNTVFMPDIQFCFDANSILRSIRFTAKFDAKTQIDVDLALTVMGRRYIHGLEPDRGFKNTVKFFVEGYAQRGIRLLISYKIAPVIIPSMALTDNRELYEAYLIRLGKLFDQMDFSKLGGKAKTRSYVYAALYYPRFREFMNALPPTLAARHTLQEAYTFIEVPEDIENLLLQDLQLFIHPTGEGPERDYCEQVGNLMTECEEAYVC